jgi:hypothetical protein
VDYASYGGTRFIDARGKRQSVGPFDTDGAALLRRTADGAWTLWPLGNATVLRVRAADLGLGATPSVSALDESAQALPQVTAAAEDGWLSLPTGTGAFSLILRQG